MTRRILRASLLVVLGSATACGGQDGVDVTATTTAATTTTGDVTGDSAATSAPEATSTGPEAPTTSGPEDPTTGGPDPSTTTTTTVTTADDTTTVVDESTSTSSTTSSTTTGSTGDDTTTGSTGGTGSAADTTGQGEPVCGDGVVEDDEQCDDGNADDYDACDSLCYENICGDHTVDYLVDEQCDDGNDDDGDGCSKQCKIEGCPPGSVSILANTDFEAGDLDPWTSDQPDAGVTDAFYVHNGLWSAHLDDLSWLHQDFPEVPVAQLVSAMFWTHHKDGNVDTMYVRWGYSDGTEGSQYYAGNSLSDWKHLNVLSKLDQTRKLVWLRLDGTSGTGLSVYFDEFRFCRAL